VCIFCNGKWSKNINMFGCVPFCTWIAKEKGESSYISLYNVCYFFGTFFFIIKNEPILCSWLYILE